MKDPRIEFVAHHTDIEHQRHHCERLVIAGHRRWVRDFCKELPDTGPARLANDLVVHHVLEVIQTDEPPVEARLVRE